MHLFISVDSKTAMSYQNAGPECLKLSAFADKSEPLVNTILYGTCTINTNVIQTLRKLAEKASLVAVSVPHFEYLVGLMLQEFVRFSHSRNCVCWPVLTLDERDRVLLFNNEYISEHDGSCSYTFVNVLSWGFNIFRLMQKVYKWNMSVSIIYIIGSVYIIVSHHFLRC